MSSLFAGEVGISFAIKVMGWIFGCFRVRKQRRVVLRERNKHLEKFSGVCKAAKKVFTRRDKVRQVRPGTPASERSQESFETDCSTGLCLKKHSESYESSASHDGTESTRISEELGSTELQRRRSHPSDNLQRPRTSERTTEEKRNRSSYNSSSDKSSVLVLESPGKCSRVKSKASADAAEYLNISEVFSPSLFSTDSKENFLVDDVLLGCSGSDLFFPPKETEHWQDNQLKASDTVLASVENLPERRAPKLEKDGNPWTPPSTRRNVLDDPPSETSTENWTPPSAESKSQSFSSDDRPILGTVAAHWPDRRPKAWDGKGIPNSTTKYKEDQEIKWENTPFETRLELALALQHLYTACNPIAVNMF